MKCCEQNPIIKLSGGESLCRSCFLKYFEKKVRKTIRIYGLLDKEETLGIVDSGGSDSVVLYRILNTILKSNKKIRIVEVKIDCRDFEKIRDYLLKKGDIKFTKIALSNNLDDEAASILISQFDNDIKGIKHLGPIFSMNNNKKSPKIIKPFCFLSKKEIDLYSKLNKINGRKEIGQEEFHKILMEEMDKFELKFPGTKNSIVNSFLDILPVIRRK